MKLKGIEFPLYIIKFCEKPEYIDDIMDGRLYMRASGYFRDLPEENTYRGDPFDGKMPIEIGEEEVYIEEPDGERVYLNGVPWASMQNFTAGFSGDDKIPIFCACLFTDEMMEKTGETSFRIKKDYVEVLAQFGSYVAMIPIGEVLEKLNQYEKLHPDIAFKAEPVRYTDIKKEYMADILNDDERDWTEPFFIKDNSYHLQNEWRLIAFSKKDNFLVDSPTGAWICDLGKFEYAVRMTTEDLVHGEFHVGE